VPRLEHADLPRSALRSIWLVGEAPAIELPCAVVPWPAAGEAIEPEAPRPGETLAILYTSGTTGPAKGVQCPHAQYAWWGANSARILGLTERDVLATTLPLFHINALNTFAQALVAGCRVAYEARFSASRFWSAMAAADATVVYLLGAMVPMLLAQAPSEFERAHRVRIGLAPGAPESAMQAFLERSGVPLIDGYGSTETNFVIAGALDAPRRGVMGWLQPGFDARVVDDEDVEVPAGEPGELVLRADEPFAFASGYHGMPEQTLAAWRNLWFHTGDRVVRDADGAFRFIDRIKDAIRRRGENISSWEVEQVLLAHAAVAEAAVYPVRSELAEDEVMAALVARPGARIDAAELCAFCAARLARFAVPRYIDVVAELPRTENGKVRKVVLRERGVTAATWDRARSECRTRRPA
jgi:crotonobetaine/carnitine-CoA ligase